MLTSITSKKGAIDAYLAERSQQSCRFIFVLDGLVDVAVGSAKSGDELHADDYAYFPADTPHRISSVHGAGLLVFERRYALPGRKAAFQRGSTQSQPILPCAGWLPLISL